MIVTVDENKERLNVTQGQLVDDCCHFESTRPLTGLKLNVDFGLFKSVPLATSKLVPGFTITYPFAAGTYALTFNGLPEMYMNLSAELVVISSTEFVIQFRIVNVADLDAYIEIGSIPDNYQYWTKQRFSNAVNVYDQFKYLDCKVTVQFPDSLTTANSSILYKIKKWQTNPDFQLYKDYFILGSERVQGWRSGSDLDVWFNVPGVRVNSKWYGGIFDIKALNTSAFWDDLKLQYAELGDIPVSAEPNFESSKIIASSGLMLESTDTFKGFFTIDQNYFQAGHSYQLFFIWEDSGEWYSSLSEVIQEEIINDLPEIIGNVTYEVEILEPSSLVVNAQCVNNLAPCQKVKMCFTLDIPSFNADMIANDLPYTFDEVYGGFGSITNMQGDLSIYVTEYLQVNAPSIFTNFDEITYVYSNGVSFKSCAEFTIPEDWAGTSRYLFFKFKLILPTSQIFNPIIPIAFTVVDFGDLPAYQDSGVDFVCDNESQNFVFIPTTAASNMIVKDNGKTLIESGIGTNDDDYIDGGDGEIIIDYSKLDYGITDRCLCVISQFSEGAGVDPCPCDEIKIDYTLTPISDKYGIDSYYMVFNWDLTHILSDSDMAYFIVIFPKGSSYQLNGVASGSFSVNVDLSKTYVLEFTIGLIDGCFYYATYRVTKGSKVGSILLCNEPVPSPLLGLPCAEFPYLDTICSSTEAESVLNLAGGTTIEHKYAYDPDVEWFDYFATVPFTGYDEVFFYAIVDPLDSVRCGQKTLFSSIRRQDCEGCYDPIPVNPCDGYLEIEQSYDDMLELLTLTSTIDPACVTPMDTGLMWSYDGIAYESYTDPIDVSGQNFVYYYQTIQCDDECEVKASGTWDRTCPYDPCGTTVTPNGCSVDIEHEIIISGFTTDHYNPDLGTGNESFDSHFISQSPYGDRTVIESRIRVDILDDSVPGYIANSCYFKRQGFYESQYFNKAATNLQSGGIITNIRMYQFIASTNSLALYDLDCSSIVFSGSGSTFATNLKNFIIADLNSAFGYTNGTDYRLVVNCTNAGVFTITFDFKDATDGNDWLGINKLDATISFNRDGATLPVTLTQATAAPDVQGCPKYLLLDSLDCDYNTPCASPMKFRAAPDGDTDCGADFAYISDSNQFNFHSIPLGHEPYTVDPVSVLTESCNKHRLIGDTENFTGTITYEWKDSLGDIVTTSRFFETYEVGTYTFKATSSDGCIVSKSINIGI